MKKILNIMTVAFAGVLAVGCNDLDTQPLGSSVTSVQKAEVIASDPGAAMEMAVNSLQAGTHIAGQFYSTNHRDYGLASIMIGNDSRGIDMVSNDDGYNWYSSEASWGDWQGNYYANLIYWQYNYTMIFTANTQLASLDPESEDAEIADGYGQALVFRAYSYYMLASMYQYTYAYNPDAPCVPVIVDDATAANVDPATGIVGSSQAGQSGAARVAVKYVWQQVIDDCTKAIERLEYAVANGKTRADKRVVDPAVAYGLRARAYLFTQKYAEAAADADKAIQLCAAEGITPLSRNEAAVPGFYRLEEHNIMWGIQNLASATMTQGVNNFSSMMSPWMKNGYGSVGCAKRISKKLFALIPATDVRRGWWMDADGNYPAALPQAYKSYISGLGDTRASVCPAYTVLKFAAAENTPGGTSGATDVPIMRVEEMYLIKAEAQGMQSPSTGAATLTSFVSTYRQQGYTCTATSQEAFQDAVWLQRRIELWGEGFAYFDLCRLMKDVDRRGCGFPSAWVFNVTFPTPVMRYQPAQSEVQTNPLIGDPLLGDNNWITPTPVPDEE